MLGVIAVMQVKDGAQEEFEREMAALADAVRSNEPGCALYRLCRAQGSLNEYIMMELYASREDLAAHGKSAHFLAASPALGKCLAAPPTITLYDVVT